jgi:hypothetical protein
MFRGHGIIILPLAILGLFLGSFFFGMVFLFVKVEVNWISVILGLWCAAAMVGLYAVTLGRSKQERVFNRATGGYEMQLSRHALFFMSAKTWAWIFVAIALVGSVLLPQAPMPKVPSVARSNAPDGNSFDEANLAITTARNGVAQGNTKNALQLANDFSRTLKLLREAGVEKSKKKHAISLTEGDFITYCHLTGETCAFLVHVPELRNFSRDAKEFIAEAAWHSATAAVLEMPDPPERLAVGIRGVMLYDAILIGKVVSPAEDAEEGIERRLGGTDKKALHPFFATTPKKQEMAASEDAKGSDKEPSSPTTPQATATSPKPEPTNDVPMSAEKAPVIPADTKPPATPADSVPAASSPASPPAVLPTPVRDWRSADGRLLRASLVGFNESGTVARVKREDGTEFEVGLEKFTAEDQAELKRLHQLSQARGS